MKLLIWLTIICAMTLPAMGTAAGAKPQKHRVVFEFVSEGADQQEAVLTNIENTLKALGTDTQVMLVAHGPGLGLLLKSAKGIKEKVRSLIVKGVVFAACQNTMRKKDVSPEDLQSGVTTVDSGVAEVIRRQTAGWCYVKSGH